MSFKKQLSMKEANQDNQDFDLQNMKLVQKQKDDDAVLQESRDIIR